LLMAWGIGIGDASLTHTRRRVVCVRTISKVKKEITGDVMIPTCGNAAMSSALIKNKELSFI